MASVSAPSSVCRKCIFQTSAHAADSVRAGEGSPARRRCRVLLTDERQPLELPLPGSQCGVGNGHTIAWTADDDEFPLAIVH
jgi:hypothetical protein